MDGLVQKIRLPNSAMLMLVATRERLQRVGNLLPTRFVLGFWFCFSPPVRRLEQPQGSGGLGEHCSSPAVGRGVCAPLGRVAQPRLLAADRGYRVAAVNRGRFLLVTFLGKTRKVTSVVLHAIWNLCQRPELHCRSGFNPTCRAKARPTKVCT